MDSFWASFQVPTVKAKWLVLAPKYLQTAFAALSDWYTWRLAEKLYGPSSAAAWSVVSIISPFVTIYTILIWLTVAHGTTQPVAMVYSHEDILELLRNNFDCRGLILLAMGASWNGE